MEWCDLNWTILAAAVVLTFDMPAQADVFNMGGTRNSDGTWTGLASLETVPAGNLGNPGQWSGESYGGYGPDRICGAVEYAYSIGKYEVTAAQYTELLNAVAGVDTYGLYSPYMWSGFHSCRIQRTGEGTIENPYVYSVAADWGNRPVNYVSYGDAIRFANWLHNGQPTGAQDASTTEDGAYFVNGATTAADLLVVDRASDWRWAVTSEDEWYKAAYHKNDGVTSNYWDYPTGSDAVPGNVLTSPDPGNNGDFCIHTTGHPYFDFTIGTPYYRTPVGEFENSESAYGTFDQGGNVWEWNESVLYSRFRDHFERGVRGGSYNEEPSYSLASERELGGYPTNESSNLGFRVVHAPVPGDANLDGVVDDGDASILGAHWLQIGNWLDGDFNGDGNVNDADAAILAAHWHAGADEGTPDVPEPSTLALLAGAALSLGLVRRRRVSASVRAC